MTMKYNQYPSNIEELEGHIDEVLSNLAVFKLPKYMALSVSLAVYEQWVQTISDRIPGFFSAEAALVHHKAALQIVIPYIFNYCLQTEIPKKEVTVTTNVCDDVTDALQYCERYAIASHAYTMYHQGIYTGELNGRLAKFEFSKDMNIGRASLNNVLHNYHQQRTAKQSFEYGKLPPSIPVDIFKKAMSQALRCIGIQSMLYSIPAEVYIPFREIAEATQELPTIDVTTQCSRYSVNNYYHLWLELVTLAAIYVTACEERKKIDALFDLLGSRVLQISIPELAKMVAQRGDIEYDKALSVLSDLILDLNAKRPDILIQPLIPIPNTEAVLLSPSLITTSNWEVCLLRNWIYRYPDLYGHVVASKKEKLACSFGSIFDTEQFKVSTRRKLKDRRGQIIGDVDVAIFDPNDGLLALFEVKWLIEPDSPRETIRANQEISAGIEQVLKNKREFENNASEFLRQVFPNDSIAPADVKELKCFVVGFGNVGDRDDERQQIYVLDYLLSCDIVNDLKGSSLRQILKQIYNKQVAMSDSITGRAGILKIKLAGYLFHLPGFGIFVTPNTMLNLKKAEIGRNDRCICGSGLKYKKCCLELADFVEDVI